MRTRWNSVSFCFEGILRLRSVLVAVRDQHADPRDKTLIDLQSKIPTDIEFEMFEMLLPLLLVIRRESIRLSADKEPTSIHVVPAIWTIEVNIARVSLNF